MSNQDRTEELLIKSLMKGLGDWRIDELLDECCERSSRVMALIENLFCSYNERVSSGHSICYTLELSCELKTRKLGKYTLREIKNIIRKTWKTNDRIEAILSEINDYSDYRHEKYEILATEICRAEGLEYDDVHRKLDGFFQKMKVSMAVLGEYNHSKKTIILYIKSIAKNNIAGRDIMEALEEVFAHEIFHFLHFAGDASEIIHRSDYSSDVVKESLASAFEWYYMKKYNILGADELKMSWDKYPVGSYPYSGAKNLLINGWGREEDRLDVGKFVDIFYTSKTDMDQACRKLLGEYDYFQFRKNIDFLEVNMNLSVCLSDVSADYALSKSNPLRESRAWDICHAKFTEAIQSSDKAALNKDELALHLGMYLANWGMYRGSAFIRNYNYREYIPIVEMILEEKYKSLLDIEMKQYINDSSDLANLMELGSRIKGYFRPLRSAIDDSTKSDISQILITKILLATLGCIPAYDQYFYKGITSESVASGTFNKKSVMQLADFYSKNSCALEKCRNSLINHENRTQQYSQAKLLDMLFFGIGFKAK